MSIERARWFCVLVANALLTHACGSPPSTSIPDSATPTACPTQNVAGEPVLDLQWDMPRETYVTADTGRPSIALNYIVSPAARVDQLQIQPDFDPLVPSTTTSLTGRCPLDFPFTALTAGVPDGTQDILSATVIASSADDISRTGRIFATTGQAHLTLRTEGLAAGDAANGTWWFLYEPAPGHARVLVAPARLDRTTFDAAGIPTGQQGLVALIQTSALEQDAASGAIYAPWGFAADWRRFARAWYASFIVAASTDTIVPVAIVPTSDATTTRYPLASAVALAAGATREVRTITERDVDTTLQVDCSVASMTLTVLTFSQITTGPSGMAVTTHAGEHVSFSGTCATGAASWSASLRATSLNGRSVVVMLAAGTP